MADVDEALYAGAGTLGAGVVRLQGIVVVLGRGQLGRSPGR
jgi:hypothetical protein